MRLRLKCPAVEDPADDGGGLSHAFPPLFGSCVSSDVGLDLVDRRTACRNERISCWDCASDVSCAMPATCLSSVALLRTQGRTADKVDAGYAEEQGDQHVQRDERNDGDVQSLHIFRNGEREIGRASCRERV